MTRPRHCACFRAMPINRKRFRRATPSSGRNWGTSDMMGNPDMAGHPEYGDLGCCQSCCCPRWTVTADALIWDRISSKSTTILGPLEDDHIADDPADRLNSNDFAFGCAAGPRLSLIRHTECFDYEVVYFGIDGWSDTRFIPQSLNGASSVVVRLDLQALQRRVERALESLLPVEHAGRISLGRTAGRVFHGARIGYRVRAHRRHKDQ